MPKRIITSQGAPTTGFTDKGTPSPLAQAIRAGNLLFVSVQGPLDPNTHADGVCTSNVAKLSKHQTVREFHDKHLRKRNCAAESRENDAKKKKSLRGVCDPPRKQAQGA